MDETINHFHRFVEEIDRVVQKRYAGEELASVPWKEDEMMKTMISDFRAQAQIFSQSCVKFSLLISPTTDLRSEAILSILDELRQQGQTLFNIYR